MLSEEHESKDDYQNKIESFQNDLKTQDPFWVIRKHITTGPAAVLSESEYYDLRNEVADHFHLHPSAVVLIGSSRMGFSIKPRKRYVPFDSSSDIDLAIISNERFEEFWNFVFEHWHNNRLWRALDAISSSYKSCSKGGCGLVAFPLPGILNVPSNGFSSKIGLEEKDFEVFVRWVLAYTRIGNGWKLTKQFM